MTGYTQPELPDMPDEHRVVHLDGVGLDLVRELNVCDDALSKWKDRRDIAYAQLAKLLTADDDTEAHYVGLFDGRVVVNATVYTERRFNSKAFQSDHPILHESYRQEAVRKRLTPDRTVR